jgi:hypothetical protein
MDANTTPDNVCQQIAAASNQHLPLATALIINGLICVYYLPFRRGQAVGAAPVLAGNVNILDVFKRLFLKTCLCVVPTCQPNMATMLPTSQLLINFFHIICGVMSLIANMLAMQQLASAGEAQQERRQCNERGIGSGDSTKNDKTTALGGGRGNGQR